MFLRLVQCISSKTRCHSRTIFQQCSTGLIYEFSFSWMNCLNKANEACMFYNLSNACGRWGRLITFRKILAWSETQTASSRVWTQISCSICYYNIGKKLVNVHKRHVIWKTHFLKCINNNNINNWLMINNDINKYNLLAKCCARSQKSSSVVQSIEELTLPPWNIFLPIKKTK